MLPRSALTLALAVLFSPAGLFAQSLDRLGPPRTYLERQSSESAFEGTAPAHVSHVEGAVSLEREGRLENAPLNMPLLSGDRLKTIDGRAEVLFADGSALHLDSRTTLDIQSDELVRLIDGRVRLNILGSASAVSYRVDSPAGSVRITNPGEYRVALLRRQEETQLEFAVLRGAGEIFTDEGTTPVRAGERAYASAGLMPSYPYAYNSANWDSFDRWSESRRDMRLGVSSQYLPEDIRTYSSTFDEYGDWRYQPTYGYVWYPRVAVGWRPYYYGRWASYPRYGWTWIGADGFAWPTHHYGRWGFSAGVWFWIPSSRWAPAYVSWAYAPGYVSWCPLGFDNRPVISINIFNVGPRFYSSSYAWTAVSYSHFGRDYYVHQRAVNWDRWDRRTPFQIGRSAPAARDVAVPRNSSTARGAASSVEGRSATATPIRWAGRAASDLQREGAVRAGVRSGGAAVPRNPGLAPSPERPTSDAATRTPDVAVPRETAVPRYVNRGNEIIRSQTERPTAPSRTLPAGPARRVDSPSVEAPSADRRIPRVVPRNGDDPVFAPRVRGDNPYVAVPRTADRPDGESRRNGDSPVPSPRVNGDNPAYQPPPERPRAYEPGEMPRRGGYSPRPMAPPPPSAGERQAPPPPRAAPGPGPAAPPSRGNGGGGNGERAVPRNGSGAPAGSMPARRGGGRGGH